MSSGWLFFIQATSLRSDKDQRHHLRSRYTGREVSVPEHPERLIPGHSCLDSFQGLTFGASVMDVALPQGLYPVVRKGDPRAGCCVRGGRDRSKRRPLERCSVLGKDSVASNTVKVLRRSFSP